jgi:CubicO group peptidase (beta-lactamase class C family)
MEVYAMTTKLTLVVLCLALVLFSPLALGANDTGEPAPEQVLGHPEVQGTIAAIDAWVGGVQLFDRVPGISVGIVLDQDLIWSRGYGYSNLATERPADADTIYSICSISKLFTSIGIMQLRDQGQLRLDDPIARHLEWFDIQETFKEGGPATIEGLLTHSSGLPRESDFPYWNGPDFPFPTRDEMIARLESQKALYPTQRYHQYSNLALSLAGEIIQARSGEQYDAYIEQHILAPLSLEDTRSHYPDKLRGEQLAVGYTGIDRQREREPVRPFFTRGITAAAGFTSTVKDLASFASWQFRLLEQGGQEVLAANTLREMHRVHWVDPDWETTWGIGFSVRRVEDMTLVSHGGGCPGYITQFAMVPDKKLAAIVLTNAGDGPAGSIAVQALKTMVKALGAAKKPAEEDLPDYSRYEGNFENPPWGGETAVRQWGDQLAVIRMPADDLGKAITKLRHEEGDTFVRLTQDGEPREPWVFEIGDDGKVTRIQRHSIYLTRIE